MTPHSELPWKVDKSSEEEICVIVPWSDKVKPFNTALFGDYRGGHICSLQFNNGVPTKEQAEANAAFIVHCVNNHEKLVEALQLILPLAKGYVSKNSVGSNQKYIEVADQAIQSVEEER